MHEVVAPGRGGGGGGPDGGVVRVVAGDVADQRQVEGPGLHVAHHGGEVAGIEAGLDAHVREELLEHRRFRVAHGVAGAPAYAQLAAEVPAAIREELLGPGRVVGVAGHVHVDRPGRRGDGRHHRLAVALQQGGDDAVAVDRVVESLPDPLVAQVGLQLVRVDRLEGDGRALRHGHAPGGLEGGVLGRRHRREVHLPGLQLREQHVLRADAHDQPLESGLAEHVAGKGFQLQELPLLVLHEAERPGADGLAPERVARQVRRRHAAEEVRRQDARGAEQALGDLGQERDVRLSQGELDRRVVHRAQAGHLVRPAGVDVREAPDGRERAERPGRHGGVGDQVEGEHHVRGRHRVAVVPAGRGVEAEGVDEAVPGHVPGAGQLRHRTQGVVQPEQAAEHEGDVLIGILVGCRQQVEGAGRAPLADRDGAGLGRNGARRAQDGSGGGGHQPAPGMGSNHLHHSSGRHGCADTGPLGRTWQRTKPRRRNSGTAPVACGDRHLACSRGPCHAEGPGGGSSMSGSGMASNDGPTRGR